MKTAIQIAEKEIAELWSSPSDTPTYTKIFEVLESAKEKEKQQIIDAVNSKRQLGWDEKGEDYYNETFGEL